MTSPSSELTQDSRRNSMDPIPNNERIFGLPSYIAMWVSSMVVIQIFIVGQSFLPPSGSLNVLQAVWVTIISAIILWVLFVLNSAPGIKYGIPFIVQARTSFGYKGARIASLIRVIPAIFWYGIGSWIGASAMVFITETIWGWGNIWFFFILFQIAQSAIAYFGIKSIKWFDSVLSVVVLGFLIYIMYQILQLDSLSLTENWMSSGSWGKPFFVAITASVGVLITASINNGDLGRFLENKPKNNWIGHFFGIVPMFILMLLIGVLSAATTGIWDPIQALVSVIPSPAVAVAMMIFIVVAQFTTNLTINIKPPALVLVEMFDMKWGVAVVVVGVLSIATFPWLLLSSTAFGQFIAFYSAFLGPLLGILLADYYLVRKQKIDVEEYYSQQQSYNWLGLGVLLISGIIGIIFLPISWMVSLPLSIILYWGGCQLNPIHKRTEMLKQANE
ncbi:NCS1 family transporter [Sporosarcina sp. P13]|uniref:NCS1 family transporter n=1 Tax=Sporosarcina sp. P13 TaxID=2048263 RepID=UPI0013045352|nr:NCS1 family transporter [Sporosarcina sp. P13]